MHFVYQCVLMASQVGISSESRSKPGSSSHLPPLSASKSTKNSVSHGQAPRPHLRSRASLEKNKINITVTGPQNLPPGLPPTPLADKRAASLPGRAHSSSINPDSTKGHSHELGHSELVREKTIPFTFTATEAILYTLYLVTVCCMSTFTLIQVGRRGGTHATNRTFVTSTLEGFSCYLSLLMEYCMHPRGTNFV